MNYFSKYKVQGEKKGIEKEMYIYLGEAEKAPNLTKDTIMQNSNFKAFCKQNKLKFVSVEYTVYSIDKKIDASIPDNVLEGYISSQSASIVGTGEYDIDKAHKGKAPRPNVKKKKKKTLTQKLIVAVIAFCLAFAGFTGGFLFAKNKIQTLNSSTVQTTKVLPDYEDAGGGMVIPLQNSSTDTAGNQITVYIDRSYLAVPQEDLQLKADIVDGIAKITLPEFDKDDYFTHVPGYTYGFSSDPKGKKIEYYSGETYDFKEDTKLYRILVKYGGGSGTKDDPYIIDYFDQLELMSEEKARGYFKQTCDIEIPDWSRHTPIDTVAELKSEPSAEVFEYDGGGHFIYGLNDSLFGTVSGATIKNVNIRNANIESTDYKNYGILVCESYNYSYKAKDGKTYETGDTLIKHCSVSCSTLLCQPLQVDTNSDDDDNLEPPKVSPPNVVTYDPDGNVVSETKQGDYTMGGIIGLGGQIEDCFVQEVAIYSNIDKYYRFVGGIAGKPANVINSSTYVFSATGNIFTAGGIAGSGTGAKKYDAAGKELANAYGGNFQGCTARSIMVASEFAGGGIIGEGGTNSSSALISNCYSMDLILQIGSVVNDSISKPGYSGGIIGADSEELNGHTLLNNVSPTEEPVIGLADKSKYDKTNRQAPTYAYYQNSILDVINASSVNPKKPKEIFTGNYEFNYDFYGETESDGATVDAPLPISKSIEDLMYVMYIDEQEG